MLEMYKSLDKESTGWLPREQVYEVCYQHQIRPDKKLFDVALDLIHAIKNDRVRYDLFMDLLDPNVMFSVDLKNENHHEYISTYKNDYENRSSQNVRSNKKIDYTCTYDYPPVKPAVFAHQDSFGSETDVKTVLSPTIFTLYGLTYRDFFIERSKEVIQKLFKDAGINLPNDTFNLIWDIASQKK
uniref:EF-hand domain-containing family member B n=1 Tax=Sipha flava TaxID=143950 RepID=A0A2S2QP01_9HEMI